MKFLVGFVVLVVAVCGEPPRYRIRYLQRQAEEAPYEPSGFRPEGQQFNLPARQKQEVEESVPRTIYGPPTTTEEIPTTTDLTTTEEPTTTLRPFSSQLNEARVLNPSEEENKTEEPLDDEVTETPNEENDEDDDVEEVEEVESTNVQQQPPQPGQEGVYYVLLQNGQLQKVQYATVVNDPKNTAYSTQLRYENVQPISGPIYTFTPENQLYQVVF